MTDQQDPITPSPELIEEWIELSRPRKDRSPNPNVLATYAARWGADQELEACCEHLKRSMCPRATIDYLCAARRPKPPSLKEQALEALNEADQGLNESEWRPRSNTIRRALESLPD
jgi:hypothetical protein